MSITAQRILGDHRGQLVAIESRSDIPFELKRIFYIFGTKPDIPRGAHAHRKTQQYLIALNGSCKVTLDDGEQKKTYQLRQRNVGLLQDSLVWGVMHDFTADCILLVLASENYDPSDYIHDYDEFLALVA